MDPKKKRPGLGGINETEREQSLSSENVLLRLEQKRAEEVLADMETTLFKLLHEQGKIVGTVCYLPEGREIKLFSVGGREVPPEIKMAGERLFPDSAVVATQSGLVYSPIPSDLELEVGDTVLLTDSGRKIVGKSDVRQVGLRVVVSGIVEGMPLIEEVKTVYPGRFLGGIEEGDEVLLDFTGNVVVGILPRTKASRIQRVTFSDIGGLDEAKKRLDESVILPITCQGDFARHGQPKGSGILLYGPPGCGKTMLARALYSELMKLYEDGVGGSAYEGFIHVKGPEILNKFIGESERALRQTFERGRSFYARTGLPAMIFIDEAEAILPRRGSQISSDIDKTLVPTFLTEVDGLESNSGVVVALATNRVDQMDEAAIRSGRIDSHILVPLPVMDEMQEILELHFRRCVFYGALDASQAANLVVNELFSTRNEIYQVVGEGLSSHITFTMGHLGTGATLATLVEETVKTVVSWRYHKGSPGVITKKALLEVVKRTVSMAAESDNHLSSMSYLLDKAGVTLNDKTSVVKVFKN